MGRIVGIDLGTTNSLVTYVDKFSGKGECIPNKEGSNLTASAICFVNKEEPIIGNIAKECQVLYPEKTAVLFKRMMGTKKTGISVDGQEYSPQQLSALILKSLKDDAEEELKEDVDKVVITVPAYFDSNQRQATIEAGKMAGFKEIIDLLDEPVAALYNADGIKNYAGKTVLIFDLGGGTLDLVVAKITEDSIEELAILGDTNCGGSDWDKAFVSYIKEMYLKNNHLSIEGEQELLCKTEMAKIALSLKKETSFTVMTEEGRKEIIVSLEEFESCTEQLLAKAMTLLSEMKDIMGEKGITKLDQIVLCGGATRMLQIKKGIEKLFPGAEIYAKDVDQAVAKGAAIYAEALMREKQPRILRERAAVPVKHLNRVTSHSYGIVVFIGDNDKKISNMVYRNTELPVMKEEVFYTRYENQHEVDLEVYESVCSEKHEEVRRGTHVGTATLKIPANLPKGSPIIVRISLEDNGTLHLHGKEESGNTEVTASMKTMALLSENELLEEKAIVDELYEKVV